MATAIDKLRWELYRKRYRALLCYGASKGLVKTYDEELLSNLRHIYYGGVPASILLLHEGMCNGHCYDRGPLVTLGFGDDDFQVVDADIDGIKLRPKYVDEYRKGEWGAYYANHCFAERTASDGTVWVYDTSAGLVIEKSLYYKMENPRITKTNDRETTLRYLYYDFLRDSNIERDKYALHIILPLLERKLKPTQPFYLEQLKREIAILKEEVDYEGICEEIHNDMRRIGQLRKQRQESLEQEPSSRK